MNNNVVKKINREEALQLVGENPEVEYMINQATAAALLGKTRQRIKQLVTHEEHAKTLGVKTTEKGKTLLSLKKVLEFSGRNEFRGKRGPQKNSKATGPIGQVSA